MRTTFALTVTLALAIACAPLLGQEDAGIRNATSPAPGVLFGGQPTAEQLEKLAAADYKTVIDLRGPEEDRGYDEAAAAEAAGLEYIAVPITGETIEDAKTLDEFIRIFRETEKPVLVHCGSGARVGAVYYAWLVAEEKMSREEALARAKEQGLRGETYLAPIDSYLDQKSE
ncbi:MAG TPA: sulfur transferase domain-containing protein [Thermoanaerobaculia bacterium]|nr:sulfur transferase domain-containing protein [Thermoanaerobaculia bacterium]